MRIAAIAVLLAGCGASSPALPTHEPERADPPRLVVLVVYDQLGSWVLDQHFDRLAPDGAIRRTMARGHAARRVRYGYAATFTAPGHAAIVSGAAPFASGIGANNVWDDARGRIPVMDDGEHAILGRENAYASPLRMRATTVADVLHHESGGRAMIASISMKDRSAILPGGRHPDLCLWFDRRAGGFTTSSYYAEELPAWLAAWRTEHPWESYREPPWEGRDPVALSALGDDDRSGEGAYGYDAAFPHDARDTDDIDAFLSLPRSAEMQLELAERVVSELHMGEDDVTDFLAISISATDYAGHAFGPDSWEYADVLARTDASVGAFLRRLEDRMPVAVLITSDHGVAPLVERSQEAGHADAVRFSSEGEIEALRAHLAARFGEGEHVLGWVQPYVYLAENEHHARLVRETIRFVSQRPGVLAALDARSGARLREDGDPIRRAIGLSLPREWPGDVVVFPSERSVANEEMPDGRGTAHGSPWSYDVEVPAIYAGPNVAHGATTDVLPQARVATTLARLLGVDPPPSADTYELPGLTPLRASR
jgi:predicted AlkP superfamily pyrophosphatase or phosphodiesterase